METIKVSPIIGWNKYMPNTKVTSYIQTELETLCKSGHLKYDNFIEELGIYSSDEGFCSLEYLKQEENVDTRILTGLVIGINSSQDDNIFKNLLVNLRRKFSLVECL